MATSKKLYHTLLVREATNQPWTIHFGDYDKEVVRQERLDLRESDGYLLQNMIIITTTDDQATIQAAVDDRNAEFNQH